MLSLGEIIYSTMKSMESNDLAIPLTFLKLSIKLYRASLSLSLSLFTSLSLLDENQYLRNWSIEIREATSCRVRSPCFKKIEAGPL